MPLKIHSPRNNANHRQKLIIVQGVCDNAAKADGVLTGAAGQRIAGQKLVGAGATHWGYLYRNLAPGAYQFTISQTNSPVITDAINFTVAPAPPPPPPGMPPVVTAPTDGDAVATLFYPYGTSSPNELISAIVFGGNGQMVNGTVTQQPDTDGNWTGAVDTTGCPSSGGYGLNVSNDAGVTPVNNLSIS